MQQLLRLPDEAFSQLDIAVANLACAGGLPGMGPPDFDRRLDWLDEAARLVKLETDRHYHKFLDGPDDCSCCCEKRPGIGGPKK